MSKVSFVNNFSLRPGIAPWAKDEKIIINKKNGGRYKRVGTEFTSFSPVGKASRVFLAFMGKYMSFGLAMKNKGFRSFYKAAYRGSQKEKFYLKIVEGQSPPPGNSIDARTTGSPIAPIKIVIDKGVKQTAQRAALPLIGNIGGLAQGGNTCFIATALQSIRQLPIVRQRLAANCHLTKKEDETEAAFRLRQEIQQTLREFFEVTDQGRTVSGARMRRLHEMLHQFNDGYLPPAGKVGDASCVVGGLFAVLEINHLNKEYYFKQKKERNIEASLQKVIDKTKEHVKQQGGKHSPPSPPAVLQIQRAVIQGDHECAPFAMPKPTIELNYGESPVRYALISALNMGRGHATAYLKEQNGLPEGWVHANDSHITRVQRVPPEQNIMRYIYAKID